MYSKVQSHVTKKIGSEVFAVKATSLLNRSKEQSGQNTKTPFNQSQHRLSYKYSLARH